MNAPHAGDDPLRECDLVLKGGITSGIVYPGAVARLSYRYRFRNIGGSSAGAIAAAVTAAAEYQRRETGSAAGFELLAGLPQALREEVRPGTSKLMSLFQPSASTRPLFRILKHALNRTSTGGRVGAVIAGIVLAYPLPDVVALVLTATLWGAGRLTLAMAAVILITWIGLLVFALWRSVTVNLVRNDFGLCRGLGNDDRLPALTPWLHELIQQAAGRTVEDDPLTFGDLSTTCSSAAITLKMFSTNLSHGRPYIFPLEPDLPDNSAHLTRFRARDRLYFVPDELRRVLPARVVAHMEQHSSAYRVEPDRQDKDPPADAIPGLRSLPDAEHFPVLLAARMSLSFPLLFSAIGLYAIDHDRKTKRVMRRCWFSDGGISSNFPVHLFDSLMPCRPTFGITLEDEIPTREPLFLPQNYLEGYGEFWFRFEDDGVTAARKDDTLRLLGRFLSSIVNAMQNWNDNTLLRMPGVRDRVARVRLSDGEGGMNLNMPAETIDAIADKGLRAADLLRDRFDAHADGWIEHRFVRLMTLLQMVAQRVPDVKVALRPGQPSNPTLREMLDHFDKRNVAPPGFQNTPDPAQRQALEEAVQALDTLAQVMGQITATNDFVAIPRPELRIRPPL